MKYLVLLLVLFTGCGHNRSDLIKSTAKGTLYVGSPLGHGSGAYLKVGNKDIVLTNAHVCEGVFQPHVMAAQKGNILAYIMTTPFLTNHEGKSNSDINMIKINETTDLCAIEMHPSPDMNPLPLSNKVSLFDYVLILGYPKYDPMTPTFGFIMRKGLKDVLHDGNEVNFSSATVYPGNSGSPVVNMNGELVGLVSEGDTVTHSSVLVTLEHIKDFLSNIH